MSYLLPHLHSGYAVDQAILSVRTLFCHAIQGSSCRKGKSWNPTCPCRKRIVQSSSDLATTGTSSACRWTK